MKIKSITIPVNVFTKEEVTQITSLIKDGPLAVEEIKCVNSVLGLRLETLLTQFREVDEDYKRITASHIEDFDHLCSVSSRRAELHKQIESLKTAIVRNLEVIDDEENQDH